MSDDTAQSLENFPPFKAMGIQVLGIESLWQRVHILLPLSAQNCNPGGTMFGGAMASLADPIAAMACSRRLPDYTIWTKSLTLDFIRPGSTDLRLLFEFPPGALEIIQRELAERNQCDHAFHYGIFLDDGTLCCRVACLVAIRPAEPASLRRGFRNKLG